MAGCGGKKMEKGGKVEKAIEDTKKFVGDKEESYLHQKVLRSLLIKNLYLLTNQVLKSYLKMSVIKWVI